MLDCQKLSPEIRAHAVKNERLPLRTVVQVLFFEQESGSRATGHKPEVIARARKQQAQAAEEECNKLQQEARRSRIPESSEREREKRLEGKVLRGEKGEAELEKGNERRGEANSASKVVDPKKILQRRSSRPEHEHGRERDKGRER